MKLIKKIIKLIDKKIIIPITKVFVTISKKIRTTNKPLEMLLTKKSSMIILSLVFAIVIFYIVDSQNSSFLEKNAEVIYNRNVVGVYNDEEYVIEGLPEKVDLTLIGTKANLYLAKQLPTKDITIDLSDLKPGTHKVQLRYKRPISSVEYKLDPSEATVTVIPKQSTTLDINTETVNLNKIDKKLSIKNIDLSSTEAIIKGSEYNIKKVASIRALVNVAKIADPKVGDNSLTDIPLVAYDEYGNIVKTEIVPSKISATIEIESPSKEVPIKVVRGDSKVVFGKAIKNITTDVSTVTLYGNSETLEKTDYLEVEIDVSNLKSSKQYKKKLKKPSGIREMSVKNININVDVADESSTELSGVKLGYINLGSNYTVQATSEKNTEVSVILKGVESVISEISATEVEAYLDLKGLGVGEHSVKVQVKGNDEKVTYEPKVTEVKIKIAEK